MARDTMTYESYEPDSFDNPPKGPVGVHRGARSVMARLCPFIVVILVAALCGVGAWAWISGEYKNVVGGSSQKGDYYAAGFLYGLTCGYSLEKCSIIGSILASNVIQVVGTTLSKKKWDEIKLNIEVLLQA